MFSLVIPVRLDLVDELPMNEQLKGAVFVQPIINPSSTFNAPPSAGGRGAGLELLVEIPVLRQGRGLLG